VGLARRIGTVGRWPVGMGLASWRYLWRTSPLHRVDQEGTREDVGPPVPDGLADQRVQGLRAGAGPLFHRRYAVRIEDSSLSPEQVIALIAENPNRAAPVEVAIFHKTRGRRGPMRVGDEYMVRMPGPWDGPVRVVDRGPASLRLATLRGHLEAGQIEFRASRQDGALRFEIESWARSGDRLSELLYDRVRVVKEMQLHMWTHFCERIGKLAGGRIRGGVEIHTRRLERLPDG
jgi:hypothetical protein